MKEGAAFPIWAMVCCWFGKSKKEREGEFGGKKSSKKTASKTKTPVNQSSHIKTHITIPYQNISISESEIGEFLVPMTSAGHLVSTPPLPLFYAFLRHFSVCFSLFSCFFLAFVVGEKEGRKKRTCVIGGGDVIFEWFR